MNEQRKTELLNRFEKYPLLRLLIAEFWLRVTLGVFVLMSIFFGLFFLRIWKVSPPYFNPAIHVSGLDLAQAWSLKRTAAKASAAQKFREADHAWRSAIVNNPADPELVRGYLRNLLLQPHPEPRSLGLAVAESTWLLRLTRTNRADVELMAQVYERYDLFEHLFRMLKPMEKHLSVSQQAGYLKALFHQRQMSEFSSRWEALNPDQKNQPEIALYHAAYLAAWGPPETAPEGRSRLQSALEDPTRWIEASRLKLAVCSKLGEISFYETVLKRLVEARADKLLDHIGYWRLLSTVGQRDKARQLAEEYPTPPTTSIEVVRLAEVYGLDLGLNDYALGFLQRYAPRFGFSSDVWVTYGGMLIEGKRWEDLREVALQIRKQEGVRDRLAGYSYFLEGRAHLARNHRDLAEASFVKAGRFPVDGGNLALAMASALNQSGYPALARQILLGAEEALSSNVEYWNQLFTSAYRLKQSELMLKAARKSHDLQPDNLIYINNYAAALLVNRQSPEQIVPLTLSLVSNSPNSPIAKVNHALALLLNQRSDEAVEALAGLVPSRLTPQEASAFYLCWFEIHLKQRHFENAWKARDRIDPRFLFPPQIRWVEQAEQRLPPRLAAR